MNSARKKKCLTLSCKDLIYLLGCGLIVSLWLLLKSFQNSNRHTSLKKKTPPQQQVQSFTVSLENRARIKLFPGLNQRQSAQAQTRLGDTVTQLWSSTESESAWKKTVVSFSLLICCHLVSLNNKKKSLKILFFSPLAKWNDKTLVQKLQDQSFFFIHMKNISD